MFVKICYGPLQYLTILDIEMVAFTSHLQSKYFYNQDKIQLFIEDPEGKIIPSNVHHVYVDKEYIKSNNGCSSKGETDDEVYLNVMTVRKNNGDVIDFAFTGTAYLCNELGRTVDTFR